MMLAAVVFCLVRAYLKAVAVAVDTNRVAGGRLLVRIFAVLRVGAGDGKVAFAMADARGLVVVPVAVYSSFRCPAQVLAMLAEAVAV